MSKTQQKLLLAGLMLGVLLEGLDSTILSTAMPRIVSDLNGLALISWVFTAYMLTSVVITPIYGKLSDLYGRKPFYLGGMALFIVASMVVGQAQSMEWLIFWRGVQGLGAGAMMPIAHSIISDVFSGASNGRAQAAVGAGFVLSSLIGPFLGGWLTDGPGWRWAFYINAPLGLIVIGLMLAIKLPATSGSQGRNGKAQIDYLGAASLMLTTLALLLGFVFGGDATLGWLHPQTLAMFGLALIGLVGFLLIEKRAADPILPLAFLKNPVFVVLSLAGLLIGAIQYVALNYTALFVQGVQGNTATSSGTAITPLMLAMVVGLFAGGHALGHLGKYKALVIFFVGMMALGMFQMTLLNAGSSSLQLIVAMATVGFGFGGSFPVFIIALQNAFPTRFMGTLNSLNDFYRLMGGAVGTSILGSVLTASLTSQVSSKLAGLNIPGVKLDVQVLTSSEGLSSLQQRLGNTELYNQVTGGLREALADSLHLVFTGGLIVSLVALVAVFFLKEVPLRWKPTGMHGHAGAGHHAGPHHAGQHEHQQEGEGQLEPVAGHGGHVSFH
ncbi:MAG TPA: MDR family MFS transporter [Chloroflexia bacterium]|nr:MDR family MFS transporter [Chloroflexia bacterium]